MDYFLPYNLHIGNITQQSLPYSELVMIFFRILDSQGEVILVLLQLSAAFNTIDHHLLLTRLRTYFNFIETVLQWFSSYLLDRFQQVTISDFTSSPQCLQNGVPQGSILGPLLFTLYLGLLQDVILTHDLNSMTS